MEDLNTVTVVGRLTRDSELGYLTSGSAMLKFSVASNRRIKRGDQWEDAASFFDVTVWGKRGEALANYLHKGKQVAVEGQLIQDRWQAKDGTNRSKVYINARNVQMIGGRDEGRSDASDMSRAPQIMAEKYASGPDGIPF